MLCGHLAIFMSAGVSSAVDCGSWVAAVCARWSAGGICNVVLVVVSVQGGFFGEHFWGDGGRDGMSLVGDS